MSVTISRFVRVMTDGKVVTDKLVAKLDSKLAAKISTAENLIAMVEQEGASAHTLKEQVATLKQLLANARQARDNAAKSELLENGKAAANRTIAAAQQRVFDAPWLAVEDKLDAALAELATNNAKIPDGFLRKRGAEKLAVLADRRTQLRTAGDDRQDEAKQLLKEVGWDLSWSYSAVEFGSAKYKILRNLVRQGAALYAREGKKLASKKDTQKSAAGKKLSELATSIKERIDFIEEDAKRNPREAVRLIPNLIATTYAEAKGIYETTVIAPNVVPKVQKLIAADPNCPEARMQEALSPQVFGERLLAVHNLAKIFGTPEIALMSPGEAVALFSYTTGDYSDMNTLLLTGSVDGGADDARKVQTKIDQALKAMAKLPDNPTRPTNRGEKVWPPGDVLQYVVGNEFTLKMFWSTGIGFSFGGAWQITVFGKSGKNVAAFSNSPHEAEVLFPPGIKFRVKSVERGESGGRVVVEEV